MNYERLTDKDMTLNLNINPQQDMTKHFLFVQRLWELENQIEKGELVKLPCIKTLTDKKGILYRVYFMNYAWGENGIIDFYSYRSKEEAEQRLKKLQNNT